MSWWDWFVNNVGGGIVYDALKAALMALIGTAIFRWGFEIIRERRQYFIFAGGLFILIFILLASAPGPATSRPNLQAEIDDIVTGSPVDNDNDTAVVLSMNITNIGTMQSSVKGWHITAIIDGVTYNGTLPDIPNDIKFNIPKDNSPDTPNSITFKKDDDIIEQTVQPIEEGETAPGILFVDFPNINSKIFDGVVRYTVTFEDALSKPYQVSYTQTGQIGQIESMPGLHTEMVCPIPPSAKPRLTPTPKQ